MANPLLGLRSVLFRTGASEAVTYTAPGGVPVPVRAVRSAEPAGDLSTLGGNPLRGVSFEIPRSALAAKPLKGGIIRTDEAELWRVTQATDKAETASWLISVERGA
jgi:hypothetical protein